MKYEKGQRWWGKAEGQAEILGTWRSERPYVLARFFKKECSYEWMMPEKEFGRLYPTLMVEPTEEDIIKAREKALRTRKRNPTIKLRG